MNKPTSKNYANKFDRRVDYWELYFDRWVDYWELYEDKAGLTTRITEALYEKICSPVLILGSGQGVISEDLLLEGKDVTSVDISRVMANKARERRGIETVVADATSVMLKKRFRSIIVPTGVLTMQRMEGDFVEKLLRNIRAHSESETKVIFSYFWNSPWDQAKALLGYYKKPSNAVYFWKAQGDLEAAKHLLVTEGGILQETADRIFSQCKEALQEILELYLVVGERYQQINNNDADIEQFFSEEEAESMSLTEEQELDFRNRLKLSRFRVEEILSFDNDVRVLVCRVL